MSENGRPFAPRGPAEVRRLLQEAQDTLREIDNELQEAHETAESAEERWTEHYDEVCSQLEEELDKLPGEDVRISMARRRAGMEAWTNHRRAERAVKKLEKRATLAGNVISACQSEAKVMRAV